MGLIIAPAGLAFAFLGYKFEVSIYEINSNDPLSITGLLLLGVLLLKGITSLFLLLKKDIAVLLAIIDATVGIIICLGAMIYHYIYPKSDINGSFRIELLILIPYLRKMILIYSPWKNAIVA